MDRLPGISGMKLAWIWFISILPLSNTTVLIVNGRARAKRGRVGTSVLSALSDLAKVSGVRHACIHASVKANGLARLSLFGVPQSLKQRFRNVWGAHYTPRARTSVR